MLTSHSSPNPLTLHRIKRDLKPPNNANILFSIYNLPKTTTEQGPTDTFILLITSPKEKIAKSKKNKYFLKKITGHKSRKGNLILEIFFKVINGQLIPEG